MTVGCDMAAMASRPGDECQECGFIKLRKFRLRARGQVTARGHHLDEVSALFHLQRQNRKSGIDVGSLPTPEMTVALN